MNAYRFMRQLQGFAETIDCDLKYLDEALDMNYGKETVDVAKSRAIDTLTETLNLLKKGFTDE